MGSEAVRAHLAVVVHPREGGDGGEREQLFYRTAQEREEPKKGERENKEEETEREREKKVEIIETKGNYIENLRSPCLEKNEKKENILAS